MGAASQLRSIASIKQTKRHTCSLLISSSDNTLPILIHEVMSLAVVIGVESVTR